MQEQQRQPRKPEPLPTVEQPVEDPIDKIINGDRQKPTLPSYQDQADAIDTTLENTVNLIDSAITNLDDRQAAMMEDIKRRFALRKQQQQQINQATLGGLGVAGMRSGRTRYATELQDSIIAAEESAGIQRIAELDAMEQQLLLEAQSANDEKRFEMLSSRIAAFESARQQKNEAILDLHRMTMEQEQSAIQRSRELREQIRFDREQNEQAALDQVMANYDDIFMGDGEINSQALSDIATNYGVDENMLRSTVRQIEIENQAKMPALVQEYQFAQENGFQGSFMEYQSYRANLGKSSRANSTLTLDDILSLDLPVEMVGLTERQIADAMRSNTPPAWFRDYVSEDNEIFGPGIEGDIESGSFSFTEPETGQTFSSGSIVNSLWDEFRIRTGAVAFSRGLGNQSTEGDDLSGAVIVD